MPQFSKTSRQRLATCHQDLQTLFNEVIKYFDCTIICGHRGEEKQNSAYKKGYSKLKFPNSKHNKNPSLAVDVIPYPLDWDDHDRMRVFAGYVLGTAQQLKNEGWIDSSIRLGGDWDMDTEVLDNTFQDFPHYEIR